MPFGQEPVIHGSTLGSAAPHIVAEKVDHPIKLENVPTNESKDVEISRHDLVASLGIPDWEAKEKKIVRRLDMTLLPQLWISLPQTEDWKRFSPRHLQSSVFDSWSSTDLFAHYIYHELSEPHQHSVSAMSHTPMMIR